MAYTTITIDGNELSILAANPIKKQKTIKSVIGKSLVQANIIGVSAQQWELQLSGIVTGVDDADLSAKRSIIEALDDVDVHTLIDGIHDGIYYVLPESLTFSDTGDDGGMAYRYTMTLVEE